MNPLAYDIDPRTLRDEPRDPEALAAWLDHRDTGSAADGRDDEYAYRTETGNAARLARRLDLSEAELSTALALAPDDQRRVLAGLRLAQVHQWQGREAVATEEFERLVVQANEALGERASFAHQHAGECAYDFGNWARARALFATALDLRADDPELAASSRHALDAAEACVTAVDVAAHLHRLVPAGHRASMPGAKQAFDTHGRPSHPGVLIDLAVFARAPEIELTVVRGIHRYADDLDAALTELADTGWLRVGADTVTCTERAVGLLADLLAVQEKATAELWPDGADALPVVAEFVASAPSSGPVFDALRDAGPATLFPLLTVLRQHRAESHEAAWRSVGLDAAGVAALDGPARARIEVDTDLRAADAYRRAGGTRRAELSTALAALPG